MKRFLDLIGAFLIVLIFLPILFLIVIFVYILLGRPILFCQSRVGFAGKIFKIYKFRTMSFEKKSNGELLPDDKRLGSFGKILRKSSLDELPGLINIIKGDMSFVGPRPLLPEYLPLYTQEQNRRHEVKPGITGWAQINGRNDITWEEKFKYDIWYVEHQSFLLDLYIIFKTFLVVLKGEGVAKAGHTTTDRFQGSSK